MRVTLSISHHRENSEGMDAQLLLRTKLEYLSEEGTLVETTVGAVDQHRLSRALPIREPRTYRNQRHYSGLFWSSTTRGHVPYESLLELDRIWTADFDPLVSWISAQPMWLRGRDGDQLRQHVPDFLLTGPEGKLRIVDVKPKEFIEHPKIRPVFAWTEKICAARRWRYEIWTGGDAVQLSNIKALGATRRLALFADRDPNLATTMPPRFVARHEAWMGRSSVDLTLPLTDAAFSTDPE